jgi:hypothetical protein
MKGRRQKISMLYVTTLEEAEAASVAGVDKASDVWPRKSLFPEIHIDRRCLIVELAQEPVLLAV